MLSEDTDRVPIVLKHLSPTWVKQLDEQYGIALQENGGYMKLESEFAGKPRPRWFDVIKRFLPYKPCTTN